MKPKMMVKIAIDIAMTVALLLLMAYQLIGEQSHEWIGIFMFFLFVTHHILNRRWGRNIFRGKYNAQRICQTVVVIFLLICMAGSMVSGILLSRYAFAPLGIRGGAAWARSVHMFCAYWGFVGMSLHLGMHWGIVVSMTGRMFKQPSAARSWLARAIAFVLAGYGIYAFAKRQVGLYLFMKMHFAFYDFAEGPFPFLLDYLAIMISIAWIGYYGAMAIRKRVK